MYSLEKLFKANLENWKAHCDEVAYSSMIRDRLDCDAYKNLVLLGRDVKGIFLSLIRKNSDEIPIHGLAPLVRSIIGDDFEIPEEIRGKVQEMKDYTLKWLDENMAKYI